MRRLLLFSLIAGLSAAALPPSAQAQSSEFGVRGLGFPGREQSARALGSAGAFALFDGESSLDPASLGYLTNLTAAFTVMADYRSSDSPAGAASIRNTRFPQFLVGGPIKNTPLWAALSYSNYTTRDFSLVQPSTITLRGLPVNVVDTLESRGGLNDIRVAVAYRPGARWVIGLAGHAITGTNRLQFTRDFSDTLYATVAQRSELSFRGVGISIGVLGQLARTLAITAMARTDGHVTLERDSTDVAPIDLPLTVGGGLLWRPTAKLSVASQVRASNWSTSSADLVGLGGVGANNTLEASAGFEYTPNPRRPGRLPLRLGVRYAKLPFPLVAGAKPKEYGVAIGSGFSFAADRGALALAIERAWRSGDPGYSEHAWLITTGVTIRP
ncbi:MAG TPA: hypothetical protein VFW66_12570 [Gemmatimonadales bacterium]|nr:hypothetical protein [Gemmatimonadales bacterium]